VYGARIHYVERGQGPVVVLVHGLGDDTGIWQAAMEPLARSHQVIAIDQVGFGRSDKPLLSFRAATFADFLNGFFEAKGISRATLVGNSLGGWVVALFALAHPEKVERLVLVDAAGFAALEEMMPVPLASLNMSSLEDARKLLPTIFVDPKMAQDETLAAALLEQRVVNGDAYTIATFLASMARKDDVLDGKLSRLRAPTLVLWGSGDRLTPLALGQRFAREIRGARLKVIPACGHMPQFECPAAFNAELLSFLAEPRPSH
jgi:triacylglycerol lipase